MMLVSVGIGFWLAMHEFASGPQFGGPWLFLLCHSVQPVIGTVCRKAGLLSASYEEHGLLNKCRRSDS